MFFINIKARLKNLSVIPITSLLTGVLSLVFFSYPRSQNWPADLPIPDNIRRILFISSDIIRIMLAIILPVAAVVYVWRNDSASLMIFFNLIQGFNLW